MNENTDQLITERKPRDSRNILIGILIAGLIILAGFFIFDHSNNRSKINSEQTQVAQMTTEKSNLQTSFDASLARLDSFQTVNTELNSKLTASNDEIANEVINICIQFWGMATANLVSLFNPEKIIFGGGVFGHAIPLIGKIKEEAIRWAQPISMKQVSFEASGLGNDAGVFGAVFLALNNIHL